MSEDADGRLGPYRLLERIGRGGMGVVYRALDTRLDRQVAVKFLLPEQAADPERRRRFGREARTAAALNHPNICIIHEVGEIGPEERPAPAGDALELGPGTPYLVMELLEGETLQRRLRDGPLPVEDILALAVQVAEGLREAHGRGIVHRDLKPQNVVIGPEGRAKLLDFGLALPFHVVEPGAGEASDAQTQSAALHREDTLEGTIAYMSPEQAQARETDARSDLFSFGTLLYEMTTGRNPFAADNPMATLARILEAEPAPASGLRPGLPVLLEQVIERCLRKDPARRYATATELLRDLRELRDALQAGAAGTPATPAAEPGRTVAVLPFVVRGSRELAYLGEGMVDLLSTNLDGAGELRAVDPHALLRSLPAERGEEIDPGAARDLARRYGAGLFVLGNLLEAGGRLRLTASLYDAASLAVVVRAAAQGSAEEIFDSVDRLTSELVRGMGCGPGARLVRTAAATTGSFPALKAYLEGEREMREMRREPAVEAFGRAVGTDPGFALAWYRLAVAALWSQQPERAWEAAQQAVRHAGRLTGRDRRLLEAFHALLRGDDEEAERLYRAIVGQHPDDLEAWYQLGELQFHQGPQRGGTFRASRATWERLLDLDPSHLSAMVHLGAVEACGGDPQRLEELATRVIAHGSGSDVVLWMRALRAYASGGREAQEEVVAQLRSASDHSVTWAIRFVGVFHSDLEGAARLAQLLLEPVRSAEVRALGHLYLASLHAARGRRRTAREHLAAARPLQPAYALEHEALLAAVPEEEPDTARVEAVLEELEAWDAAAVPPAAEPSLWLTPHEGLHVPLRAYLRGLLSARLGRPAEARLRAAELDEAEAAGTVGAFSRYLAGALRAHALRAEGRPAEALRALEGLRLGVSFYFSLWSPFFSQILERFARAELLHEVGRSEEALRWFDSFGENSVFDVVLLAPSHLNRARIYESMGLEERARHHRARYLRLCRHHE